MTIVPLKVLIIDKDSNSSGILYKSLSNFKDLIISIDMTDSIEGARRIILEREINTIYIDPLTIGLDKASDFIFLIRRSYKTIVFVLFTDFISAEEQREEFYKNERKRFTHYFKLNKKISIDLFDEEVKSTIKRCQGNLKYNLTEERISKLQEELSSYEKDTSSETINLPYKILEDIKSQLDELRSTQEDKKPDIKDKTVFLSYRFTESDYVEGLKSLLEKDGFKVVTGQDTNTYISKAILDRIKSCQFFLCLMTKSFEKADDTFATSTWLLEEKGAALAFGKNIVLMVEEGVTDIGGLQGDWQRIPFTPKSFIKAALKAVEQLKTYTG